MSAPASGACRAPRSVTITFRVDHRSWAAEFASATPAFAADLPTKKPAPAPIPEPVLPSNWHFELTGYLWATSLVCNTGVGPFPTNPFFASFGDILSHF